MPDQANTSSTNRAPLNPPSPAAAAILIELRKATTGAVESIVTGKLPTLNAPERASLMACITKRQCELDDELVICGNYFPHGARRTVEDWNLEKQALERVKSGLQLEPAAQSPSNETAESPLISARETLKATIEQACENCDPAFTRLIKAFVPQELRIGLGADVSRRQLLGALLVCTYKFEDETAAEDFLIAIEKEQRSEGAGIAYLVSERYPTQERLNADLEGWNHLVSVVKPYLTGTMMFLRDLFQGKDCIKIPNIFRGEFSIYKRPEERK